MDRKERAFWNRLRPSLSTKVFVKRIENGVAAGDPDVFLMKGGKVVWVELKWADIPKRMTSKLLKKGAVRVDQINWHLEYAWKKGTSYILIGTEDKDYLMPGRIADRLNDMTLEEIEKEALCAHRSIGSVLEEVLFK